MTTVRLIYQFDVRPDERIWIEIDHSSTEPPTMWIRSARNLGGGSSGEHWQAKGDGIRIPVGDSKHLKKGLDMAEYQMGDVG
jgi:hypothetical protein